MLAFRKAKISVKQKALMMPKTKVVSVNCATSVHGCPPGAYMYFGARRTGTRSKTKGMEKQTVMSPTNAEARVRRVM